MAKNIPAGLKPVKTFLLRAMEMDKANTPTSDIISYACRRHALQKAFKDDDMKSGEGCGEYLGELLDKLEADKPKLIAKHGEELMSNKEEQLEIIKNFAMNIFKSANDTYQAGKATKKTAVSFHVAAAYFEVAGEEDEALSTARLAAKFNATEIMKALKEGRTPMPPQAEGTNDEEDEGDDYGFSGLPSAPNESVLPKAPDHNPQLGDPDQKQNMYGFLDLDQGGSRTDNVNVPAGAYARDMSSFENMGTPKFGDIPKSAKLSVRGRQFMSVKFNAQAKPDKAAENAEDCCRAAHTALEKFDYEKCVKSIATALKILENRKPRVFAPQGLSAPAKSDVAEYLVFAARTLETAGSSMPAAEAKARAANLLSNALQVLQNS